MFFSTSNGYTEDCQVVFSEEVPYLKSVDSKWDSDVNSNFNYSISFSLNDFYDKLGLNYSNKLEVIVLERSSSNRIVKLKINGVEFSGRDIYNKLKIRSTDFEIKLDGDKVIVNTKGFGHGVGMSQYGALGMAKAGYNYKEILNHYYDGTNLKKLEN
jgi:stage II sporulation protein D